MDDAADRHPVTVVSAPMAGRAVGLVTVPDPVFRTALLGPGIAIDPVPRADEVVSPVDGRIVSLRPHAFVVVDSSRHGVLTHLGIDTVHLGGAGFEVLAHEGDMVRTGQPVVRWNPVAVAESGRSPVCPVIALQAPADALSAVAADGPVRAGDHLFDWTW